MSWLQASDYEKSLLGEIRQSNGQLVQLAQLTCLAKTVEPLLLRNMRLRFMPESETELESMLWHSPLVSTHNKRNFVLHHGVASLLAEELQQQKIWLNQQETAKPFNNWQEKLWHATQQLTRHWPALDKLEQQLRFSALQKDKQSLQQGLRHALHEISQTTDEEQRLKLARWTKQTLPALMNSATDHRETEMLAQYAAEALGSSADWTRLSKHRPLPEWLKKALPEPLNNDYPDPETDAYQVGVRVYYEPQQNKQVLEFTRPEQGASLLRLPAPLPAPIQISYGENNQQHIINTGKKIKLDGNYQRLVLTTIDGQQYELLTGQENIQPDMEPRTEAQPELYLVYVKEDAAQAQFIADWLSRQNMEIKLVEDTPRQVFTGVTDNQAMLMRLWSKAAQQQWRDVKLDAEQDFSANLLLRTDKTATPLGLNPAQIIDLPDLQVENKEQTPSRQNRLLLAAINDWLAGKVPLAEKTAPNEGESENEENKNEQSENEQPDAAQLSELLKELDNPSTPPKRRLEIGDLLAEMGDPRPGVGVKEYEIIEYSPEVKTLLDELNDISTQPPRRLEIGNQLDELGDPRVGVGLDENGLPEIDWVKIPAGEFIYGGDPDDFKIFNRIKTVNKDSFYISRYTITNLQYQAFIDDGGYDIDRWWQGLNKPVSSRSFWPISNRPKTSVNWYEAVAFTNWLSSRLGYKISLPSEQQWEKAARGTDGRTYPWGEKYISGYANIHEKTDTGDGWYLEETTAVGMYPQGQSPYGVKDMSGNVWEWCLNKYYKPKIASIDSSGDYRALRGGSRILDQSSARVSFRLAFDPVGQSDDGGFRVVCVLPFTDH